MLAIDVSPSVEDDADRPGRRFDAARLLINTLDQGDRVAILAFAGSPEILVGAGMPKLIEKPRDRQELLSEIERLQKQPPRLYTDFVALFDSLEAYLIQLDRARIAKDPSSIRPRVLVAVLSDGEDFVEACDAHARPFGERTCVQHQQDALTRAMQLQAQLVATSGLTSVQESSVSILPVAIGATSEEGGRQLLGALASPQLEATELPGPDAADLLRWFDQYVVSQYVDRVIRYGQPTPAGDAFTFTVPAAVRRMTVLLPGADAGNDLALFYPDQATPVSDDPSSRDPDYVEVTSPAAGTWWVRTGGQGQAPRALLRFDLDVALSHRVVPRCHDAGISRPPLKVDVDLRDRTGSLSLLSERGDDGQPLWSVTPRQIDVPTAGASCDGRLQKSDAMEQVNVVVRRGTAAAEVSRTLVHQDGIFDRRGLARLGAHRTFAPDERLRLEVGVRLPTSIDGAQSLTVENVRALVSMGGDERVVPLTLNASGVYAEEISALSLLGSHGSSPTGPLTVRYDADVSIDGRLYPAQVWSLDDADAPTVGRAGGWIEPEAATFERHHRSDAPGAVIKISQNSTLSLGVVVHVPPDPEFHVGRVVAHITAGGQVHERLLTPPSGSAPRPGEAVRFGWSGPVTSLLDGLEETILSVEYELDGSTYRGRALPPRLWVVPAYEQLAVQQIHNSIAIKSIEPRRHWLRSRQQLVAAMLEVECTCDEETGFDAVSLQLQQREPEDPVASMPSTPILVIKSLGPGEWPRRLLVDLTSLRSELEATLPGELVSLQIKLVGEFSPLGDAVNGGDWPILQIDNRTELRHLAEDDWFHIVLFGSLAALTHFSDWTANRPWIDGSFTVLMVFLIFAALALSNTWPQLRMGGARIVSWLLCALVCAGLVGVVVAISLWTIRQRF
jgi:hypothetical protein